MEADRLFDAIRLTNGFHELKAPASDAEVIAVESELGFSLPAGLRSLYLFSNGLRLCGGNLNIYPLRGEWGIATVTERYRGWHHLIPDEIFVIGNNGSDETYGIWSQPTRNPIYPEPVIEIGEIFEPDCFAVAGTDVISFIGRNLVYCVQDEVEGRDIVRSTTVRTALQLLEVPEQLRLADDPWEAVRNWADPMLPESLTDSYSARLNVDDLRRHFESTSAQP